MDFEEKKKKFEQIAEIAGNAERFLENLGSKAESSISLIEFAESAELSKDDLYDLVHTYLDQEDSGVKLEKVVVDIVLDKICKIL